MESTFLIDMDSPLYSVYLICMRYAPNSFHRWQICKKNKTHYFINGFLNANSSSLISLIRLASCIIRIWNYAAIFFDNLDADWKSYFAVWLQRVDVVTKEWEKLLILKYSLFDMNFLVHFVFLKILGVYRLGIVFYECYLL